LRHNFFISGEEKESQLETLSILAEVTIAFVAFSTIVASIKLSIGGALSNYQKLLIHYFTESSMLSLSIALITMVLLDFFPDREAYVATIACTYTFISTGAYLVYYLNRRIKINAPTLLISKLVIGDYILMIFLLGVTVTGIFWQPSITIMAAVCLWSFLGSALIFSTFLSNFIDIDSVATD